MKNLNIFDPKKSIMSKTIKTSLILLSIATVTVFQAFRPDEPIKVGLSMGNTSSDRWRKDHAIFEKTVAQIGGTVLFAEANNDTSNQVEQAKKLISQGIKVLVVVPADGEKAAAIVEMAHKANIKVIAYDRLIKNCNLDYYISYDSEKVGELQAKHVIQQKSSGNYILINGPAKDNNSKLIKKGQMKILNPLITKGSVKIILDHTLIEWNEHESYTALDDFLTKGGKIPDVVLGASDRIAMGALKALKKHNLAGKVLITGQDADLEACKEILAGNISMTVYKPIKPLAYTAAIAAMSLAKDEPVNDATDTIPNGKIKVPSIILTPFAIEKNTVQNVVIDGHLKEEDIYKK